MWSNEMIVFWMLGIVGTLLVWSMLIAIFVTRFDDRWRRHHPKPKH